MTTYLIKAILFIFILSALYGMRICYVLWEYVNMRERRSTCSGCMGGPGRLPSPPPAPLPEPWGGEGGEPAGRVLPGILSREGGIFACELGGSHSRVDMANLYGRCWRRRSRVCYFSILIWRWNSWPILIFCPWLVAMFCSWLVVCSWLIPMFCAWLIGGCIFFVFAIVISVSLGVALGSRDDTSSSSLSNLCFRRNLRRSFRLSTNYR